MTMTIVMKQKKTARQANTTCSLLQSGSNRPDQTGKIIFLFCNDYRGNEALAVSNAKNKVWTNLSRIIIVLPIYKFTIYKFYQIIWLSFLGLYYPRQQKYLCFISEKSFTASLQIIKITHRDAYLKDTLSRYEDLIKCHLHYNVFNLISIRLLK